MKENSCGTNEKEKSATDSAMELLATVSHEIRNPLNNIIGLAKILNYSESPEERETYTRSLVQVSENLLELINDIMDYGKLESNKLKLNTVSTDLKRSIKGSLSSQESLAKMKGLVFIVDLDENIPFLFIDKVKINQVVLNVVSNAIKFTSKGTIEVKIDLVYLDETEAAVKFVISDTGIGIPEEKLDSIFEAFDQGSDVTNIRFGGTGLGLYISQKIIRTLGGEIKVKSEVGKGSEFSFTLICAVDSSSEKVEKSSNEFEPVEIPGGLNGLVVDDNNISLLVVQKYFDLWNIGFEAANNGLNAIKKVQKNDYDFILMDINMPQVNGLEATQVIRNLGGTFFHELPIIALTASGEGEAKEQILKSGFTDVLQKPFHPRELLHTVLFHVKGAVEINE